VQTGDIMSKNIWWETHRPATLEGFVGQPSIKAEFELVLSGEAPMQNYIFSSRGPGTGKTTLAQIIATTLGYQIHKFNASSKKTRGIEFIEEYIIPLARSGLNEVIIFLDEADRITTQAQDALKGVIEDSTCYFILTCNDINKVSPWLQSRCQVRTFDPIPHEALVTRLATVAAVESKTFTDSELVVIARAHEGDLRNALGALQTLNSFSRAADRDAFVLRLTTGNIDSSLFLRQCFKERDIDAAYKTLTIQPTDPRIIVRTVFEFAMDNPSNVDAKVKVIDASVQAERDLLLGVNEYIALMEFCRSLCASRGSA
tara:strand:+ start:2984 stop:3928 length:945 start_codon:yes stop_codon:yes gene_type:complete